MLYRCALLVVVAALTHLGLVLTMPWRSPDDAYARLARVAPAARLVTFPVPHGTLPDEDPALASAACLYDLRAAGGTVLASLDVAGADVASLSVYSRHGQVLYGLTGRSASEGRLALTIAPVRPAAASKADRDGADARVRVETDEPEGIVVAQALAVGPSATRQAANAAARLSCVPAPAAADAATQSRLR